MSETMRKPIRNGRGSMLAAMQREPTTPSSLRSRTEEGAIDYFKLRTAGQRAMNETRLLFEALARMADDPRKLADNGSLAEALGASRALAVATAIRFTSKPQPSESEIAAFRGPATHLVAHIWEEGGLRQFDVEAIAEQHAAAFQLISDDLLGNIFSERTISGAGSLAMTAAGITETLMRPVAIYDFRRDKNEMLAEMVGAVLDLAQNYAGQAVPGGREDDFRSVLQTAANGLSGIMAGVYERKARQVVTRLAVLPEQEREAFSRRFEPMPEILRTFHGLGMVFIATALAAGQKAAGMMPRQENTLQR